MQQKHTTKSEITESIKSFTDSQSELLSKLDLSLKIILVSSFSIHDQIVQIFSDFELPKEITESILSYIPITVLHEKLGATYEQLLFYAKRSGFKKLKYELIRNGGYFVILINID